MKTTEKILAKVNFENEDYTLKLITCFGKKLYKMEDSHNNIAVKKVLKKEWKVFFKLNENNKNKNDEN